MLGGYIGGENLDAFIAELDERFAKTSDFEKGAASTIISNDLTPSRILGSDTDGKVVVTELSTSVIGESDYEAL